MLDFVYTAHRTANQMQITLFANTRVCVFRPVVLPPTYRLRRRLGCESLFVGERAAGRRRCDLRLSRRFGGIALRIGALFHVHLDVVVVVHGGGGVVQRVGT